MLGLVTSLLIVVVRPLLIVVLALKIGLFHVPCAISIDEAQLLFAI